MLLLFQSVATAGRRAVASKRRVAGAASGILAQQRHVSLAQFSTTATLYQRQNKGHGRLDISTCAVGNGSELIRYNQGLSFNRQIPATAATTHRTFSSSSHDKADDKGSDPAAAENTDTGSSSSSSLSQEAVDASKRLIEHISDNRGDIQSDYLKEEIVSKASAETLSHLAKLLRDQVPHLRPKALTLLERALELQKQELKDEKEDQAQLAALAQTHTELGIVHHQLGDLDMALLAVQEALELRQEHLGVHHPETAASLIHFGMLLQQSGDNAEAIDALQTALKIQTQHAGDTDEHAIIAASHNNLGALYYRTQQHELAVQHYSDALRIYKATLGEQHKDTAGTYNNLAMALRQQHQQQAPNGGGGGEDLRQQALEHCQKALQIRQEVLGPQHADTAASHYSLAQLLSEAPEQWEAALEQYQAACDIQVELYGPLSPLVAATHNNMGALRYQRQDVEGALTEYDKALSILERAAETDSANNIRHTADLAATHNNRGIALLQKGDLAEALQAHEKAKTLLLALQSNNDAAPPPPQLAMTLGSMGNIYKAQKQFEKALETYREAHALLLQRPDHEQHADVAASHNNIGLILSVLRSYEEACGEYRQAQQRFATALGPKHPHVASCHFNLGLTLVQQYHHQPQQQAPPVADGSSEKDFLQQAGKEFDAAREIWMESLGLNHPQTKTAMKYAQDPLLCLMENK